MLTVLQLRNGCMEMNRGMDRMNIYNHDEMDMSVKWK
jgi:hypothetical protein